MAETPGFSFFAITRKTVEKEKMAETKPSTKTSKLKINTQHWKQNPNRKLNREG
ncbi:hypothetical protein [Methanosarcina sp. UBA5]|uniref:hypothetical protein n=1 Tax=Methanosarcina sp. UBA5 TaxID=1915593 RepID=UPI0032E3B59A